VASARASLRASVLVALAGVLLALTGAGRPWARVSSAVELPGLGRGRFGGASLSGNDLAPLSGLALLALVLVIGIAATRGRGRVVVGLALVALGLGLVAATLTAAARAGDQAAGRAGRGQLEGVAAGSVQVATPRTGPLLVAAGGLLIAVAGAEAVRRGRDWPALGAAFRAPPDRPAVAEAEGEPPWEGD
jgi:Tryptophan-associated transmembrane protein (Trp_oprn_chp)